MIRNEKQKQETLYWMKMALYTLENFKEELCDDPILAQVQKEILINEYNQMKAEVEEYDSKKFSNIC